MGLRRPLVHNDDLRQGNYKRWPGRNPYIMKSTDRETCHEAVGCAARGQRRRSTAAAVKFPDWLLATVKSDDGDAHDDNSYSDAAKYGRPVTEQSVKPGIISRNKSKWGARLPLTGLA